MEKRGNEGRGSKGSCGGTRKKDGSGGGVGNLKSKSKNKKIIYKPTKK